MNNYPLLFTKKLVWMGLLLVLSIFVCRSASAQDFQSLGLEEYEKQLNAILKTRFDEEKAYISKIMAKIKADEIPRKLVDSSFKWVRNKRPGTKYPFVYFAKVFQLQAKRLKIEVPVFDLKTYTKRRFGRR